jgi:Protein of unknown function (DUF2892)
LRSLRRESFSPPDGYCGLKRRRTMNLMPRNEHSIDRIIRVALGLAVLSLFFVGPQTPWALLGLIPLATGVIGSCPLYTALGFSTCALPKSKTAS